MAVIDERLIDPDPAVLVKLLDRATRAANARLKERRLEKTPVNWHRFLRLRRQQPHGQVTYNGGRGGIPAALVQVAWWSDAIGRKHWRVLGKRYDWWGQVTRNQRFSGLSLWHVYPERVLLRQTAGAEEFLVVCACGMAGTPAALGWTGERCGPCHDRLEEAAPPLTGLPVPLTLKRHTNRVNQLVFTHDGRLLSGGSDGRIVVWDLETGNAEVLLHRRSGTVHLLTISSTGLVAVTTSPSRILLRNLDGGEWRTISLRGGYIQNLKFSEDGQWLAAGGLAGVWLVNPEAADEEPRQIPFRLAVQGLTFLSEREAVVNAYEEGLIRLDLQTGTRTPLWPHNPPPQDPDDWIDLGMNALAFMSELSPDHQWLAIESDWDQGHGIQVLHLPSNEWMHLPSPSPAHAVQSLGFTPSGQLIVVDVDSGVHLWDLEKRSLLGSLYFPLQVQGFMWGDHRRALSPDGTLLAGAQYDGTITVWPWLRLLTGS